MTEKKNDKKTSVWKSIRNGLFFAIGMIFIAYAFKVTQVDLSDFRQETRVASRTRVIRALANPEVFEYKQVEVVVNIPIYLPCPASGAPEAVEPDTTQAYLVAPTCGDLGETITVEGFNFAPGSTGPIGFVPKNDPNYELSLVKGQFEVDENGHFTFEFPLPNDRASDDVQYIRVVARQNVGAPLLTQNAKDTWDKIIETVFMAFLATLIGTILAFPISFLAARNLMVNVKSPLTSMALNIIGWPAGIAVGGLLARWLMKISDLQVAGVWFDVGGVVVGSVVIWFLARWALLASADENAKLGKRILRILALLVSALLLVYAIYDLASLGIKAGEALLPKLGAFDFLANFILQFSDIMHTIMILIVALVVGGTVSSLLGRVGQRMSEHVSAAPLRIINALFSGIAIATLFVLVGALIDWLYQVDNNAYVYTIPGIVGGVLGILLALFTKPKASLPVGMVVYFIVRTILNAVRSVEALVMAIVFAIVVGMGPFAGVLALGLHTVVSLAKLYSEQVESIMAGPLEAIEATGANRLQTIVYAVIPQIIPPYISYTMYRWDINVRMSTIIGFVGGGGIGLLLQQNINLLNYRSASTQMIAIAVVVAAMDFISSKLREKTV